MEFLCFDLRDNGDKKDRGKDCCADKVAQIHRHGHGIAASFAQRGAENLDDPKDERDLRNLAELAFACCVRVVCRCWHEVLVRTSESMKTDVIEDGCGGANVADVLDNKADCPCSIHRT